MLAVFRGTLSHPMAPWVAFTLGYHSGSHRWTFPDLGWPCPLGLRHGRLALPCLRLCPRCHWQPVAQTVAILTPPLMLWTWALHPRPRMPIQASEISDTVLADCLKQQPLDHTDA